MADAGLPLFHRLYGAGCDVIPAEVAAVHAIGDEHCWHGEVMIERGGGWLVRPVCWLLGFPPEAENLALTVTMTKLGDGEIWRRLFGDWKLSSRFYPGVQPQTVTERLGPIASTSRLDCDQGGVTQVLVALTVFSVDVPKRFWPQVDARESADLGQYRFAVAIRFPSGAPLIAYQGTLSVK